MLHRVNLHLCLLSFIYTKKKKLIEDIKNEENIKMSVQYSSKVNTDGTWRKYYGWTVICPVIEDLIFLNNFITYNNILSKYFSPLPYSSYHVTLYNIWSVNSPLLACHKEYINKFPEETQKVLLDSSRSNFFNPRDCMNNMFAELQSVCNTNWDSVKLTINKVIYTGNTITITFIETESIRIISKCRKDLINKSKKNDNMRYFHMTLAYKCKTTDYNDNTNIQYELDALNLILKNQQILIRKPCVCSFEDMTNFTPLFKIN